MKIRMQYKLFALLLFTLFALGCNNTPEQKAAPKASGDEGRVVRLADGDTFTLLLEGNRQLKVRLYGIDAPEKNQAFGNVSREKMQELTTGHNIRIEEKDKDRYGRTVGIAWRDDGLNLNEEMLRSGLAWHYKEYDKNNPEWEALEAKARNQKLGLWSQKRPTPPWEYRKQKREQSQKKKSAA